ncbi:hypothetical protein BH09ACT6_BH09ACT6_18780 [soil metagenome]
MSTNPASKQRGNEIGVTGREVARNVKRVRLAAGLTQQEVSQYLAELGRPIPVASIGKIESADRRVEVDDLMSLAIALGVTPITLLLPHAKSANEAIKVTGYPGRAREIWEWASGAAPLDLESDVETPDERFGSFIAASIPWWFTPARGPLAQTEVEIDGEHPEEA